MITVLFSMRLKSEAQHEFQQVVELLTQTTRAEDIGCVAYTFLRQTDDALSHVLFEQWRDQDSLNAHVARLQLLLGPPDTDESYPDTHYKRRLPRSFLELFNETQVQRYEVLA